MKKLLLTAAAVLVAANMFGQGQGAVSFTSVGAADTKKIKDETGAFASGTAYAVALYWGDATQNDPAQFTQAGGSATFLTGTSAGTYFGGGRTITTPGSAINGPVLNFQVRAWKVSTGSSYDSAAIHGAGPVFQLKTKDLTNPLETTPNLYQAPGYVGFQLVPEPSVIALGVIGAGALLMLRRRK
jgi:hypothetical protein